jgi:hypothetical protein
LTWVNSPFATLRDRPWETRQRSMNDNHPVSKAGHAMTHAQCWESLGTARLCVGTSSAKPTQRHLKPRRIANIVNVLLRLKAIANE